MHLETLSIRSNLRPYSVYLEQNSHFFQRISTISPAVFVVDEQVWALYQDKELACFPRERVVVFKAEEEHKTLEGCCSLYEKIMTFAPRKNLTLVSVGGGIIQDVTGFVASTLYRGIQWIFVPSTLLAQVDSCIGAKTSLNFKHYKNLLGSFYPPSAIHLWSGFVQTLSDVDYYSGIGEMAKLHLMASSHDLSAFLAALPSLGQRNNQAVLERTARCLEIKKEYIENDEFDTGKRNMLNYGHCFGHAIESACNFAIPHGQAVVLGMLLANRYAVEQGLLSSQQEERIRRDVLLPIFKCVDKISLIDAQQALAAMGQDKKRTGNGLALVMLTDQGMRKITDLTPTHALALLNQVGKWVL